MNKSHQSNPLDQDDMARNFKAIRALLEPHQGHRLINGFSDALSFVIEASTVLGESDIAVKAKVLRYFDSVTEILGDVGDVVSNEEFEKIKTHYSNIQMLVTHTS